ncbi:MAG: DUF4091 domain-containing protein [Planctomycetota bacterium]|jgi:hypothetical protein
MMNLLCQIIRAALILGILLPAVASAEIPKLDIWAVDPLVKVFRDAEPQHTNKAFAEVARGEHATLQIVIRSSAAIEGLHVDLPPLSLESKNNQTLRPSSIRFVGYVPVDRPIQKPPKDRLRKPPADYPDPLLESKAIKIGAGEAQPVWATIPVPVKTKPGLYRSVVTVSGKSQGQEISASLPVAVKVFNAVVGRSRLWVTNWFCMHFGHKTWLCSHSSHLEAEPEPFSDAYWKLLRQYARNMAQHRQNVIMISPLYLASYTAGEDGKLKIDFSRFDRWVTIFIEEGLIGRIEGEHCGIRSGNWESQFLVKIRKVENDKVQSVSVNPKDAEADRFYSQFLPALVKHLREKGWLEKYIQHLADEPIPGNLESYRDIATLFRKYAPELRIIEACMAKDLIGAVHVWVPIIHHYHKDYEYYCQRQRAGEEIWFYTCWLPQGEYANRMMEHPLIKTRLLHWINFRYGATGYLHWGYNHWPKKDPFKHTTLPAGVNYYPAGDSWIVYPGKNGPIDSIRHEPIAIPRKPGSWLPGMSWISTDTIAISRNFGPHGGRSWNF